MENDKVPPHSCGALVHAQCETTSEAEVKSAEKVPRRQSPRGFEVVFQSSKPRCASDLVGGAGSVRGHDCLRRPCVAAERGRKECGCQRSRPQRACPMSAACQGGRARWRKKYRGHVPPVGFGPRLPGEQRQADSGLRKEPSAPPSPPLARHSLQGVRNGDTVGSGASCAAGGACTRSIRLRHGETRPRPHSCPARGVHADDQKR